MIEQINQLEEHARSQGMSLVEWINGARILLNGRPKTRWKVRLEPTNDGSGEAILNLPPELMEQAGLKLGDQLGITSNGAEIVLHLPKETNAPH